MAPGEEEHERREQSYRAGNPEELVTSNIVTILAIDDEPLNNELMVRAFRKREGRRVITALSGPEALEILATTKIDVILTDYSMPDMSGVELIERARAIAPHVVSIMLTGYPELPDVINAQARGLVPHVISKPWKASDVYEAVERALAMRGCSSQPNTGLKPGLSSG